MIVCFDNNLLIWGVRQSARAEQEYLIERTVELIRSFEGSKTDIIVPAPILGEYLLGTPKEEHDAVFRTFMRRFQVVSYDAPSAKIAAELWQDLKKGPMAKEDWLQNKGRNELKVDCQFVAIAIHHGADCIYSHDPDIPKIANGRIKVLDVPEFEVQTDLFGS